VLEDRRQGLVGDDRLDHGATGLTVPIGDQDRQSKPRIAQHLVQAMRLRGQQAAQFLPLSGDQAQVAQRHRRDERSAQQAGTGQDRQPLGIGDVGLASRDRFDRTGIDHPGQDSGTLQRGRGTLPVHPGARHDHDVRAKGSGPFRQGTKIALEGTELTVFYRHTTIRQFGDGAGTELGLMYVQTDDAGIEGVDGHGRRLEQQHDNDEVLCSRAPPGNGLSVELTALFSVRCPPLLTPGRQAIRGTRAGQQVQLDFAVENHHTFSRPQPLSNSTPTVSFIIGGVASPHDS
jgi:hypothetical protein